MKILETQFHSKGFFHEQIFRKGEFAIYKRTRVTKGTSKSHYELILIKNHPAYEISGIHFEEGESYPNSALFGTLAWSLPTEAAAYKKLEEVKKYQKELKSRVK